MKKEQIQLLFEKFEQARYLFNEIECWSARDLQQIFGYSDWRNFLKAIDKAKSACSNSDEKITDHFVEANKMVKLGSGSEREVEDIGLKGDKALFGGFTTNDMKHKLLIPLNRPLADFLPTLTIKAKDFATELTSHNVVEKDLNGQDKISNEHVENNVAVRKMLQERGVQPEKLSPVEDVAKIKRKLQQEEKRALKGLKKLDLDLEKNSII